LFELRIEYTKDGLYGTCFVKDQLVNQEKAVRFGRGRQHYVTEAKEREKFSKKPSTVEAEDEGGQGPFWAEEPLMMVIFELKLNEVLPEGPLCCLFTKSQAGS
jgi:arginine/ornithine N-succinyltransferase beta subunit